MNTEHQSDGSTSHESAGGPPSADLGGEGVRPAAGAENANQSTRSEKISAKGFRPKKYINNGRKLEWAENLSDVQMDALRGGEIFTLCKEDGTPHSEVLMDSYDQIRERRIELKGRPQSKNDDPNFMLNDPKLGLGKKRGRGRPKGSKNTKKAITAEEALHKFKPLFDTARKAREKLAKMGVRSIPMAKEPPKAESAGIDYDKLAEALLRAQNRQAPIPGGTVGLWHAPTIGGGQTGGGQGTNLVAPSNNPVQRILAQLNYPADKEGQVVAMIAANMAPSVNMEEPEGAMYPALQEAAVVAHMQEYCMGLRAELPKTRLEPKYQLRGGA